MNGRPGTVSATRPDHLQQAERWEPFVTRMLAFLVGAVILLYQLFTKDGNWLLSGVGAACLGPVVAQSVATVWASVRGGPGE